MNTKSKGQKHRLDKFYTKPEIARQCVDRIELQAYDLLIEPSAGNGSFSSLLPHCLTFDIHPESSDILEQDWFDYLRLRDPARCVLVIGNPPFGQQNNLAIRFINHAAQFADTIAFILPLSFRKQSVQDRIDPHLHLSEEWILPKDAFLLEEESYSVPSVFQIWEWRSETRPAPQKFRTNPYFEYTRKPSEAELRIRRIGGRAGYCDDDTTASITNNYWIKVNTPYSLEAVRDIVNSVQIPAREYGTGPRSISKCELNQALIEHYESHLGK